MSCCRCYTWASRARAHLSPDEQAGILGVAADLASVPPEIRPALDLLLGNVIVVRDRAAARRVIAGQPGGTRAVTLKGEIFHANGPVSGGGGGEGGAAQATLLARGRQRRELNAARSRLDAAQATLDQNLGAIEADSKQIAGRSTAPGSGRKQPPGRSAQKAGQAADQARIALETAERQAAWAQDQRQRLQSDLERSQAELTRLAADLSQVEVQLDLARRSLRQENARLDELGLDELQTQHAHWSTRLAVAERALNDARTRQAERQAAVERTGRSREALDNRLGQLKAGVEAVLAQHG